MYAGVLFTWSLTGLCQRSLVVGLSAPRLCIPEVCLLSVAGIVKRYGTEAWNLKNS